MENLFWEEEAVDLRKCPYNEFNNLYPHKIQVTGWNMSARQIANLDMQETLSRYEKTWSKQPWKPDKRRNSSFLSGPQTNKATLFLEM